MHVAFRKRTISIFGSGAPQFRNPSIGPLHIANFPATATKTFCKQRSKWEKKMNVATIVVLGIVLASVLIVGFWLAKTYNQLVVLKNQTENGFNQIKVQLKRRHDLIPNLVECVRSYMAHERETMEAVIAARNQASSQLATAAKNPTDASALSALAGAEGALAGALGKLSFVMEDYPNLQANETVASLTEELLSTENRIAFSRQSYNDWVTAFNAVRQIFPTVLVSSVLGFGNDLSLLEFEDGKAIQQVPQVVLS